MENLKVKLTILANIAKELNKKNVTWAVGGSMLLYFKGILTDVHDLDIMSAERDVETVKDIILMFGSIQPAKTDVNFKTKYFLEFIVDGIDIDVMAGLTVIYNKKEYYFPLEQNQITDYTEVNGTRIPLQSLKEWRKYYELMGRMEKVKIIDAKEITQ